MEKGYTSATDLWAIGSVVALMLTGRVPFHAKCVDLARPLQQLDEFLQMHKVEEFPRDLLHKIFVVDEVRRITAKRALDHSWFVSYSAELEARYRAVFGNWKEKIRGYSAIVALDSLPCVSACDVAPGDVQASASSRPLREAQVSTRSRIPIAQVEDQNRKRSHHQIDHRVQMSARFCTALREVQVSARSRIPIRNVDQASTLFRNPINHGAQMGTRSRIPVHDQIRPRARIPIQDVENQASARFRLLSIDHVSESFNEAAQDTNRDDSEHALPYAGLADTTQDSYAGYQAPSYINDIRPMEPFSNPFLSGWAPTRPGNGPLLPYLSRCLVRPEDEPLLPPCPTLPRRRIPLPVMLTSTHYPKITNEQKSAEKDGEAYQEEKNLVSGKKIQKRHIYGQDADHLDDP
ncbi:kinase-like domain-containing protein [Penicillium taxi]|uniref:kinase-like domain-containing protein n=1 Tax=Penicillium taxi TaxID=168475 RepID=UPI002544D3F3|nr:kinase-like domain-containing protein [Penicillium taxi]KAJ5894522.1 kinase-like domain-containing protein [Penicillium taxi]